MKYRLLALVVVFALLATAGPALAAPAAGEKAWVLKGTLQARESYQFDAPTLTLYVDAEGYGHAMHLGRYRLTYTGVVNTVQGTADVSAELIAANGDRIFAEGTGQGTPTGPNLDQIVERYTITGGTGRFADAGGSFTVNRELNRATGEGITAGTLSGIITLP
jgi:hypothetical protein